MRQLLAEAAHVLHDPRFKNILDAERFVDLWVRTKIWGASNLPLRFLPFVGLFNFENASLQGSVAGHRN